MSGLKTRENDGDVHAFIEGVENKTRQADARVVLDMMTRITGEPPRMWGDSIVGFGSYEYTYDSGRSGRWFLTGFSPRKAALTVYIMPGFKRYPDLIGKLGKVRTSVSCLYVTRLANLDLDVLEALVAKSVDDMRRMYDA